MFKDHHKSLVKFPTHEFPLISLYVCSGVCLIRTRKKYSMKNTKRILIPIIIHKTKSHITYFTEKI